ATTSISRPSTKRPAFSLPSRYFAATPSRNGVSRGSKVGKVSGIARSKQSIERARRLALAALRPAGLSRRRPGEHIEMHPRLRADETAHEQRSRNSAALAAADIVDVRDLGF